MSLRLGDQVSDISLATIRDDERVSLSFDPREMRPIMLPTEKFEQIMTNLGFSEILANEPPHKGKEWMRYLRNAGVPAGETLFLITQHPDFNNDIGVNVGYTAPAQTEPETETETETEPETPAEVPAEEVKADQPTEDKEANKASKKKGGK